MTEREMYKLASLVSREQQEFKDEMLKKDAEFLFENSREIYATDLIADCLQARDFLENIEYDLFPKKNVLNFITNYYFCHHSEIREDDLLDMFFYDDVGIRKALKQRDNQM